MKTFTFRYDPKSSLQNANDLLSKAIESGTPYIEEDQMNSNSIKALLSVATENRLKLFKIIHNQKPESLYELSKLFNADLSYISREAKILESLGIIELVSETVQGRERLKPVALYDRILFDFNLAQNKEKVS